MQRVVQGLVLSQEGREFDSKFAFLCGVLYVLQQNKNTKRDVLLLTILCTYFVT